MQQPLFKSGFPGDSPVPAFVRNNTDTPLLSAQLVSCSNNLRSFVFKDKVVGLLFLHLATLKNNAKVTPTKAVENYLRKEGVSRSEVTKCWRKLEECGCGRFVKGGAIRKSHFVWAIDTKVVCAWIIDPDSAEVKF